MHSRAHTRTHTRIHAYPLLGLFPTGRRLYASYLQRGQDARRAALEKSDAAAVSWGSNDALYPLTTRCFEHTQGQYTYKLCPFTSAEQRNTGGAGAVHRLGARANFDRLAEGVVVLERGEHCDGVGSRRAEVRGGVGYGGEVRNVGVGSSWGSE